MPFHQGHVYPHLMSVLGNPKPIQDIRQRIVSFAERKVLEIGVGPGVNFAHYDSAKVTKVYTLEPNPEMIRMAEQQRRRAELDIASGASRFRNCDTTLVSVRSRERWRSYTPLLPS